MDKVGGLVFLVLCVFGLKGFTVDLENSFFLLVSPLP